MKSKFFVSIIAIALLAGASYYYFNMGGTSSTTMQAANMTLVLTSPPRETPEEGELAYKPIAEYLSKVLGRPVVYKHPGTWGLYRTEMLNGNYDIMFQGGHFADYLSQKMGYHIVAKMPQLQEFAIIVRKDDKATTVAELAGETVCTPPPPNQGALLALSQFDDKQTPPMVVPVTGNFWKSVHEGVLTGRCRSGVLVVANLNTLDKDGMTKTLLKTKPQPNQAWSVSSRLSPEDRVKIANALTAPEAAAPTETLRTKFNVGDRFVAASNAEYAEAGLAQLLNREFGFETVAKSSP